MIYIIIPTFNQADDLKKLFTSFLLQNHSEYQIILVNDGSTDTTLDVCINFKNLGLKIDIVQTNDQWWCGSINIGLWHLISSYNFSDSDVLAFANSDVILPEGFLIQVNKIVNEQSNFLFHPSVSDLSGNSISVGKFLVSWFPFITTKPSSYFQSRISFGTARFLFGNIKTMLSIGFINRKLKQYQGDSDFTYRAFKMGVPTIHIDSLSIVLNNENTGFKNESGSFVSWIRSLRSIRSPNNISYKYKFLSSHNCALFSMLIALNMTINSFIRFSLLKLKRFVTNVVHKL